MDRHSNEIKLDAIEYYEEGLSLVSVVDQLKEDGWESVPRAQTVANWIREAGKEVRRPRKPALPCRPEAMEMLRNGATPEKVMRRFGVSRPCVWHWVRAIKIENGEEIERRAYASRKEKPAALEMIRNGARPYQVRDALNVPYGTVHGWVREVRQEQLGQA